MGGRVREGSLEEMAPEPRVKDRVSPVGSAGERIPGRGKHVSHSQEAGRSMRGPGSYRDSRVAQGMGRGRMGKKVEDLVGGKDMKLGLRCQHPPPPHHVFPKEGTVKGMRGGMWGEGTYY